MGGDAIGRADDAVFVNGGASKIVEALVEFASTGSQLKEALYE